MSNTRSKKSAGAVVANGSGGGVGVGGGSIGRIQLKGVLDGLVKRSINEDKVTDGIVVDGDVEEGARDLLELNSSDANGAAVSVTGTAVVGGGGGGAGSGVGTTSGSNRKRPASVRRRGRKRRRKDYHFMSDSSDDESKERHIPHVMTLFDRKVDLARFTSTTPLYTMCRDWMSNNPEKLHHQYSNVSTLLVSGSASTLNHTSGTTPTDTPTPHPTNSVLPAPIPLPTDATGRAIRLDIPKPLPLHQNSSAYLDKVMEKGGEGDMAAYKAAHLKRWKEIRSHWRKASALNQARYTDSLKMLREMFQR